MLEAAVKLLDAAIVSCPPYCRRRTRPVRMAAKADDLTGCTRARMTAGLVGSRRSRRAGSNRRRGSGAADRSLVSFKPVNARRMRRYPAILAFDLGIRIVDTANASLLKSQSVLPI